MASIRVRPRKGRPPAHVVLWRNPQTGPQEAMVFDDAGMAENMKRIIEAQRTPDADAAKATLAAVVRKRPTVRVILEDHIAGLPSVTERTRADYRRDAERHITPTLGAIPVDDLTPASVKDWLRLLSDSDMSDKTIANVH